MKLFGIPTRAEGHGDLGAQAEIIASRMNGATEIHAAPDARSQELAGRLVEHLGHNAVTFTTRASLGEIDLSNIGENPADRNNGASSQNTLTTAGGLEVNRARALQQHMLDGMADRDGTAVLVGARSALAALETLTLGGDDPDKRAADIVNNPGALSPTTLHEYRMVPEAREDIAEAMMASRASRHQNQQSAMEHTESLPALPSAEIVATGLGNMALETEVIDTYDPAIVPLEPTAV